MSECIYLVRSRREAQFTGQRLQRSFLPQVLQRLCFFVQADQRVYVAVRLSAFAAPDLVQWARSILGECGERCDPHTTLQGLIDVQHQFREVYIDHSDAFLASEA